jgi:hypothetical protein
MLPTTLKLRQDITELNYLYSMTKRKIIEWILKGDVSIQYQVYRDLLGKKRNDLREKIATEGWGARFLSYQQENKHWGRGFYQPTWTSTHYTLLDLKNLGLSPDNKAVKESINLIFKNEKGLDGGINSSQTIKESDVCLNGMALNYACYFGSEEEKMYSVVDFIITQQMNDGGFNCRLNRSGARHSSLHSTLSVLEGILEYSSNGYQYRLADLKTIEKEAQEFILMHKLFISDRTGKIIKKDFTRLSYPSRWRYDLLKALDYFRLADHQLDKRMKPAIDMLLIKRKKDGRWTLQANHAGRTHFEMEKVGQPSRWNTLRALRVLAHFKAEKQQS